MRSMKIVITALVVGIMLCVESFMTSTTTTNRFANSIYRSSSPSISTSTGLFALEDNVVETRDIQVTTE